MESLNTSQAYYDLLAMACKYIVNLVRLCYQKRYTHIKKGHTFITEIMISMQVRN